MFNRGNGWQRKDVATLYSENQIESTLNELDIVIMGDTMNDFQCLCPFHGNTNTPSFAVSKTSGKYLCFNESCAEYGTLIDLIKSQRPGTSDFAAARMINKFKHENAKPIDERIKDAFKKEEMPEFSPETVIRLSDDLWKSPEALEYMRSRGFTDQTLKSYRVGYSKKRSVIAVPMHNVKGIPVGFVGRKINVKKFDNSKKLPVRQTLWNIHRAIRTGSDTVIVCESTFDAMLISQAGYPNVVACLGGNFNAHHEEQLRRYFNKVIIFTDWDNSNEHNYDKPSEGKFCSKCRRAGYSACKGHNPGRDTGQKIATALKGKTVMWASYDYGLVFPAGVKDAGDMTQEQIRKCILNAVSNQEYQNWDLYYQPSYDKRLAASL